MDADDELVDSIPDKGLPIDSTDGASDRKRKLGDSDDDLVAGIDKKGKSGSKGDVNSDDSDNDSSEGEGDDVMNSESEEGFDDDDDASGENEYREDGFLILDQNVVESDDDAPKERRQKVQLSRLKKNTNRVTLDDEDLQILKENQEAQHAELFISSGKAAGEDGQKASNVNADGDSEDEIAPEVGGGTEEEDAEQDEMSGFIVDYASDDEGAEGRAEEERVVRPVVARRLPARSKLFNGPSADAIQDSMDIFGMENVDDLEIDDEDDVGLVGDGELGFVVRDGSSDKMDTGLKIERQIRVDNFYTDKDENIRTADLPERYYDQMLGREMPDEVERKEEAMWMVSKLADKLMVNQKPDAYGRFQSMSGLMDSLLEPVEFVLTCIQEEKLEIPFIWAHRRDYLHTSMTRDHLWQILSWDEKWDTIFALRNRIHSEIDSIYNAFEYNSPEFIHDQQTRRSEILTLTALRTEQEKQALNYTESMKDALDLIDNTDDDLEVETEREKVIVLRQQIYDLEKELPQTIELLLRKQREQEHQVQLSLALDNYSASGLMEVKNAFPRSRYEAMIDTCTDDEELKDIHMFLAVLLKGAMKDKENNLSAKMSGSQVTAVTPEVTGDSDGKHEDVAVANETDGFKDLDMDTELKEAETTEVDIVKPTAPTKKRTQFHDKIFQYSRYRKVNGIRDAIQKIYLSPCHMGDAVRNGFAGTDFPATLPGGANEYANMLNDLVDGSILKSNVDVNRALTTIVATELAAEPSVKRAVRHKYREVTTISTNPTGKGLLMITPFSEYFGLHFIKNKPLKHFFDTTGTERSLFLKLVKAEKEGLINIIFDHPGKEQQATNGELVWVKNTEPYIISLGFGYLWFPQNPAENDTFQDMRRLLDLLRYDALDMALCSILIPQLEIETRCDLLRIGKEAVIEEAVENFSKMLDIGPYQPAILEPRDAVAQMLAQCPYRPHYANIVSIHVVAGAHQPVCMVYLDKEGVLCASDLLPSKAINKKDETLEKFITAHKPSLVIVNTSGGFVAKSTMMNLKKRILPKIKAAHEKNRQEKKDAQGMDYDDFDDEGEYNPEVLLIKDDISEIFKMSDRSKKMFPEFHAGVRAAICLGRYVQEPLAEYCNLWTSASASGVFGYEVLFLKLHPLLSLVKSMRSQLLISLERVLVGAVCDIGVDINQANTHDHLSSMLAFVGGLGLRKANALRASIRNKLQYVSSRAELFDRKILKDNVWKNSASFLKIPDLDRGSIEVNPFDNTRIHPECYHNHEWAPKICANAMDNEDWVDGQDYFHIVLDVKRNSKDRLEKLIIEGKRQGGRSKAYLDMWANGRPVLGVTTYRENVQTQNGHTEERVRPAEISDKLSNLLLEEYCATLEEKGEGKHKLQFDQIKEELRFPWLDMRKSITSPTISEMFTMITGESDTSIYVGLKMGCEVLEFDEKLVYDARSGESKARPRAFVKTDCGMKGIISMYELSDNHIDENTFSIQDYLQVGQRIIAVVVGVDKERQSLDMSIKPTYIQSEEDWWIRNRFQNRQMQKWFENVRATPIRDLSRLYMQHFQEEEAFKQYRESLVNDIGGVVSTTEVQRPKGRIANQRHIVHPLFVNCGAKEAEERLLSSLTSVGGTKYDGNVIIRPSSKGPDCLSITWAFNLESQSFMHFDIEEKGKQPGSLGLGSQLFIKYGSITEPFMDLDEIYIRFVDPMNDFAQLMKVHKSFRSCSVEDVEKTMKDDFLRDNTKVPYYIRYEPNTPGMYVLTWYSYKSSNPIKKAKIVLLPTGYLMERRMFPRPADIIKYLEQQVTKGTAGHVSNATMSLVTGSVGSTRSKPTRFSNR